MAGEAEREIKLKSSDGAVFSVPRNVIAQSETINKIIIEKGLDAKNAPKSPEPILVENVEARILEKILEWCMYHVDKPVQVNRGGPSILSEWDIEYMKSTGNQMHEVIWAVHQLEIPGLADICAQTVADIISGASIAELRQMFGADRKGIQAAARAEIRRRAEEDDPFLRQGTSGSS